ncbi:hypothetical protein ACFSSA_09810 [Luteolibacter algae]|uniref:Uncharacterized protein n=1 Tax=Luteolibacter algae TaxID=454151 RepID=A0ABW5D7G2_9BACT
MNPLLEAIVTNGLVFDALGIIGLGVLALAALKLTKSERSWGGSMMAYGAVALLAARVFILLYPFFGSDDFLHAIGPIGTSLTIALPPLFLTFGLAGVVWGLWGHEKWMKSRD